MAEGGRTLNAASSAARRERGLSAYFRIWTCIERERLADTDARTGAGRRLRHRGTHVALSVPNIAESIPGTKMLASRAPAPRPAGRPPAVSDLRVQHTRLFRCGRAPLLPIEEEPVRRLPYARVKHSLRGQEPARRAAELNANGSRWPSTAHHAQRGLRVHQRQALARE